MPDRFRRSGTKGGGCFETFYNYFGDLKEFGIDTDEKARAAAKKAWRRLGEAFLASRPERERDRTPWALEQFGEP